MQPSTVLFISLGLTFAAVKSGVISPYASTTLKQYLLAFAAIYPTYSFLYYVVYEVLLYPVFFSPLRHLPGPKEGNSIWNGQGKRILKEDAGEPQREWVNNIPNDGLLTYRGLFNRERLMPTSPKLLAEVLNSKVYIYTKPPVLRYTLGRLLGVGILMAEGDEHKRQRKILMPAFHAKHVKAISTQFWDLSKRFAHLMTDIVDGKEFEVLDMDKWSSRVTLDIIGLAGFGMDFGALTNDNTELLQTYRTVFTPNKRAMILGILGSFFPPQLINLLPVKRNQELSGASKFLQNYCYNMVQEKKQNLSEKKEMGKDILSIMIEEGQFSDEEMKNQIMTFLAAGHETTATAVTWCLYLLGKHPEIQKRLRHEIRSKISALDDPTITPDTIDGIKYLSNVCLETLRHHPPLPITMRIAMQDTTLDKFPVRKGTVVMVAAGAINRSVQHWGPDANDFNPDRWDKEGGAGGAISNYSNLTFIHGPRSCIGQKFAVEEFKAIMCALIGRFNFELEDPNRKIEKVGFVTIRPKNGMPMKVSMVPGW